MKLSKQQVEDRLTAAWGKEAVVVPWRYGSCHSFAVTDRGSHWMPLVSSWAGGRQVFEPASGDWPDVEQDSWDLAVVKAAELARVYFEGEENRLALRRLPRGMVIAEGRNWTKLADNSETFLIGSQSKGGTVYQVGCECTCPDWLLNGVPGGWCKHRIARALAIRATEILNENGAGSANDTSAPGARSEKTTAQDQDTTQVATGQAQGTNTNGKLVKPVAESDTFPQGWVGALSRLLGRVL